MTTFNNALLSFAQRSGAVVPVDPAQSEPDIVTIGGQRRRITVMVQVNGQWEKIDPTKLRNVLNQLGVPGGQNALQTLAESCHKIYGATGPANASSFTVYLGQSEAPWSLTGATLGRVANRFKDAPPSAAIIKIEYKTDGSDKTQTIELKDFALSEGVSEELTAEAQKIAQFTNPIFTYRNHLVSKKALPTLVDPVSSVIDSCIKDAGAKGNRCAALSLAKIELDNRSIEDIVKKYKLNEGLVAEFNSAQPNDKIPLLAEALIGKAAAFIENQDPLTNPFLNTKIKDQRKPCFEAITTALEAMIGKVPTGTPAQIVQQYANRIRVSGEMLDLPFFLAFKQPFIIIHKANPTTPNKIMAIGNEFKISDTIENCNFDGVNIFYYTTIRDPETNRSIGHYQSVVLSQPHQETAMKELLRRNIKEQIEGFIPGLRVNTVLDKTKTKESDEILELFSSYPEAKQLLIDRFKREFPAKIDSLDSLDATNAYHIASNLRAAIHGGPIVTEVK